MQLPATQRMELVVHAQSASETRADRVGLSRENDFAGSTKTSMMAFPVEDTKGWTFALQYPTDSVGFRVSFWMWFGLGGLDALPDANSRCRGADLVVRRDGYGCDACGCPDGAAECLLRSDARALSRI